MRWAWLLLLLTGCFGTSAPESVYYVLEAPPATASTASPRSGTLLVRRFATAPGYDRSELVYRTQALQLRLHPYDLWAARPGRMVSDAIAAHLAGTRLFASVVTGPSEALPVYELRGEVGVIDARALGKDEWVARLEVRMEMVDVASERELWHYTFATERPIAKHTPAAMVDALDAILGDELGRVTASIDQALPR